MLKNTLTLVGFFVLFGFIMVTSGCGNTNVDGINNQEDNTKSQDYKQSNSKIKTPEREVDISGIIKSIVGNEVVITQVDMEAIREQMMASRTNDSEDDKSNNNFVASGGMRGMGGKPPGEGGGEKREEMNELMRENSLGDVKILIPVGIPMYARNIEASLVDVSVESSITVWLDKTVENRKIAEFVILR